MYVLRLTKYFISKLNSPFTKFQLFLEQFLEY